nr:hypothetical protein CFP56_51692 [Quercus suber]
MTLPLAMGSSPVFVVHTGRPAWEIIRPDKERTANNDLSDNVADFQDCGPSESCKEPNISGITGKNGKSTDLEDRQTAAELFEERIAEIDKELKRYHQAITPDAKNIGDTSKENLLESLSLTDDQFVSAEPTRAQQPPILMPHSRAPLAVIDENNVQISQRTATWKRINRIEVGIDIVMEDIVGEKRGCDGKDNQSELLKKRKVS